MSDAPQPDGLPMPSRFWAILTIALGLVLAVLNGAIANVALLFGAMPAGGASLTLVLSACAAALAAAVSFSRLAAW
ncbi:MAG: hypothetical protein EXR07_15190 [Acetobacteraceae bacterium]|nr:hypothetical protein [Acetobacteraceae bacterium]